MGVVTGDRPAFACEYDSLLNCDYNENKVSKIRHNPLPDPSGPSGPRRTKEFNAKLGGVQFF
jgi:hypothetical protein